MLKLITPLPLCYFVCGVNYIILYKGIWFCLTGKAPSIWDHYFHTKKIVVANPAVIHAAPKKKYSSFHRGTDIHEKDPTRGFSLVDGDIACDSYNKLDEDIKNLIELGVSTWKLSSYFTILWIFLLMKTWTNFKIRWLKHIRVKYMYFIFFYAR